MNYVELEIAVKDDEQSEIVTAVLADYPFDSFAGEQCRLKAYIPSAEYEVCRGEVECALADMNVAILATNIIEQQDWNKEWESGFEPVDIEARTSVRIRAAHHAAAADDVIDVVVEPEMAFGTGHHITTALMVRTIVGMGVEGMRGLDMGCGTGVLAIVAAKCGAAEVVAVDTDEWACRSCRRSIALSGVESKITVLCGSAESVTGQCFDFVVANINRNILLGMMPELSAALRVGGRCVMSGFLTADIEAIERAAAACGMEREAVEACDGWAAVVCRKVRGVFETK